MKSTKGFIYGVLIVLLAACGPPPEEVATLTASAWTPTPLPTSTPPPTPTSTPIPFDLTVTVTDEVGSPIAGASVVFPESGNGKPVQTDGEGKFTWTNLVGEAATIQVSAQGYFSADQSATLQRGTNEVIVQLKSDPFGLLPSKACAAGEKFLYAEDFQDGKGQGWQNITAATDFAAQNGWSIATTGDGNTALFFSTKTVADVSDRLQDFLFENAVWRLKVRETAPANVEGFSFLNWKQAPASGGETRYPFQIGVNLLADLTRLQPEAGHFSVGRSNLRQKSDAWYFFEISAYDGVIEVWVDGKNLITYHDPQPLPAGTIGIEVHIFKDADVTFTYDDFSVCELSAPFTSNVPPAP